MSEFIYCPMCGSDDIENCDYEEYEDNDLGDDVRCLNCGWEGLDTELVSKD